MRKIGFLMASPAENTLRYEFLLTHEVMPRFLFPKSSEAARAACERSKEKAFLLFMQRYFTNSLVESR